MTRLKPKVWFKIVQDMTRLKPWFKIVQDMTRLKPKVWFKIVQDMTRLKPKVWFKIFHSKFQDFLKAFLIYVVASFLNGSFFKWLISMA